MAPHHLPALLHNALRDADGGDAPGLRHDDIRVRPLLPLDPVIKDVLGHLN